MIESILSNALYTVRDGNGGEGGAIRKSFISNAGYAIGDGNGGEGTAIRESIISYACHAVGCAIVGDGFGDVNFTMIIVKGGLTSPIGNFYAVAVKVVVIQIT